MYGTTNAPSNGGQGREIREGGRGTSGTTAGSEDACQHSGGAR